MADKHHVVVDGSNLATEGRTSPSLRQLDEAVQAYAAEDPTAQIVVVVDATFGHRIDPAERGQFDQAELHGELVSPLAGAIGRGDAFVLRIAERTGAVVLSNDSFQEFHAEHPWLFDTGRLVGGKPVPGVGWIFTPRSPVRGARSLQATDKAKKEDRSAELPASVKAAELAKAAKKAARRGAGAANGAAPKIGDVRDAPSGRAKKAVAPKMAEPPPVAAPKTTKTKTAKKAVARRPGELAAESTKPAKKTKAAKAEADKKAKDVKESPKAKKPAKKSAAESTGGRGKAAAAAPAKKVAKKTAVAGVTTPAKASKATKTTKATKATKATRATTTTKAAAKRVGTKAAAAADVGEGTAAAVAVIDPHVLEAIDDATAEALSPPERKSKDGAKSSKQGKSGSKGSKRRRTVPPLPAVNEPLPFINFVAAFPVGSEVEGEVATFTSHGAMIEVDVPGGDSVHCYIPLAGLGDPPPHKAREVLTRGQRRAFVLVSLDPPRRVAELALPEAVAQMAQVANG